MLPSQARALHTASILSPEQLAAATSEELEAALVKSIPANRKRKDPPPKNLGTTKGAAAAAQASAQASSATAGLTAVAKRAALQLQRQARHYIAEQAQWVDMDADHIAVLASQQVGLAEGSQAADSTASSMQGQPGTPDDAFAAASNDTAAANAAGGATAVSGLHGTANVAVLSASSNSATVGEWLGAWSQQTHFSLTLVIPSGAAQPSPSPSGAPVTGARPCPDAVQGLAVSWGPHTALYIDLEPNRRGADHMADDGDNALPDDQALKPQVWSLLLQLLSSPLVRVVWWDSASQMAYLPNNVPHWTAIAAATTPVSSATVAPQDPDSIRQVDSAVSALPLQAVDEAAGAADLAPLRIAASIEDPLVAFRLWHPVGSIPQAGTSLERHLKQLVVPQYRVRTPMQRQQAVTAACSQVLLALPAMGALRRHLTAGKLLAAFESVEMPLARAAGIAAAIGIGIDQAALSQAVHTISGALSALNVQVRLMGLVQCAPAVRQNFRN